MIPIPKPKVFDRKILAGQSKKDYLEDIIYDISCYLIEAMFYENRWPDYLQWTTPTSGEIKSELDTYCYA